MKLSRIVVLVLLNSSGFQGVRFPNTLYALELGLSPVCRVSSILLAAGSDSHRSGPAA
ncbi:MAG TPA: hypothetical protein VJ834_00055 [Burkholderiales bacterium]|nr:hypothetical protein [Burkholderiales bacterium]